MFTGLIEAVGRVERTSGEAPRRLVVRSSIPTEEVMIGDSVAVEGCCLTVVDKELETLSFEAAAETIRRTTIGSLRPGCVVHLERALALGQRLDGHLVTGHVDGTATVLRHEHQAGTLYLWSLAPKDVAPLVASQGAVALAGVSLTVASVDGDRFSVALIPHTLAKTNLGELAVGEKVNLEADIIARYVQRLLAKGARPEVPSLTRQFLEDKGFL